MNLEQFVKENIKAFNEKPSNFKKQQFNDTQIKDYLRECFIAKCSDVKFKEKILKDFAKLDYQKSKIIELANNECLYKNDVIHFLEAQIFLDIFKKLNLQELKNKSLEYIKQISDEKQFKFIQSKLSKILEKALFLASIDGFSTNLLHINAGIMTANAGDSAEFLFVARAILAGFNASSVDVRSSRYDAIVDYNGTLLRIQIKGISQGEIISFKDRDRGGQGIDHRHETNQGKRITSKDCDIYVAVDKQIGICYLIPMSFADKIDDEKCAKVKLEQVGQYKENWEVIKEVAKSK
ncbi:group I intron-associated PD-(D/E)XK endonuclease [Campylobacter felis]|uniref:Group I intron-associated PD-(D/E)XK endonuclease n=1 Tax=Campylobacter felis TaxID=2974565 RepID=A0ABT7I6U9_9BACT|nr:group I intron-associated PD-(D/E)XK endonuclease [Campylobacter upsaliensis]MDL0103533.1 group I intron-associated PD-(D/E)XK endonuclease [Campylobacter felis]MDL0109087.1 group I intron-associated PD-(D/E)XK endonuclease [Campylobacter felis]MDL0147644.1 group I intron-associated PD-(D/E)XK endonuclease [Campylobacter felis]